MGVAARDLATGLARGFWNNRRSLCEALGKGAAAGTVWALPCLLVSMLSFAQERPTVSRKATEQTVRQYLADHPEFEKELIEQTIHQYLTDHPEVVMEAMQRYQVREEKKRAKLAKEALVARNAELFHDPATPAVGGAETPVQIVEFFDYRCAFCKRADPIVRKLLEENPNVRIIYKEFPVLGSESVLAAKASIAAYRQGAYVKFHDALMNESGPLTPETVSGIATRLGMDLTKLQQDMESVDVAGLIQRNHQLAEALQIDATPTFIIGGELVRGVLEADDLRARIAKAQARQ